MDDVYYGVGIFHENSDKEGSIHLLNRIVYFFYEYIFYFRER